MKKKKTFKKESLNRNLNMKSQKIKNKNRDSDNIGKKSSNIKKGYSPALRFSGNEAVFGNHCRLDSKNYVIEIKNRENSNFRFFQQKKIQTYRNITFIHRYTYFFLKFFKRILRRIRKKIINIS